MDKIKGLVTTQLSNQVSEHLARYYLDESAAERFRALIERAEDLFGMHDFCTRPFAAQGIAHLVREALKEISQAVKDPYRGKWQVLGRAITEARTRLNVVPPTEHAGALDSLIATIDELDRFFKSSSRVHERGLVNLISHTTGAIIAPATAAQYQKAVADLSSSAHNSASIEVVETLYANVVELLERIFDYSAPRLDRLEELATIESPSEDDGAEALVLITDSHELRLFLSSVSTPEWLWKMGHDSLLRPASSAATWPIEMLCDRLRVSHAASLLSWLERGVGEWGSRQSDSERIASAARALRQDGNALLLSLLRRYPDSEHIRREMQLSVRQSDPSSRFVEDAFIALGGGG